MIKVVQPGTVVEQIVYKTTPGTDMLPVRSGPISNLEHHRLVAPACCMSIGVIDMQLRWHLGRNFSDDMVGRICLACSEAVTNAVQESPMPDPKTAPPDKLVPETNADISVSLLVFDHAAERICVVMVINQLPANRTVDITLPSNLPQVDQTNLGQRGRGLFIIRECADAFSINYVHGHSVEAVMTFVEQLQP